MAVPAEFKEQNFTWKGPTEDIEDLPSFIDADSQITISCWQLSEEELAEVASTGVVWLHIWGHQPPVSVGGLHPFAA